MTVRVYRSTDVGAPALNNSVGTLINVLDACLVTGYGSQVGAGWTKEYSGTNKAAYKQGTGSNGFYLRVDDTTTPYASITGYESMTDVDTGTNPFPYETQLSGGTFCLKSNTVSSASRPWVMVATEKLFYFWNASAAPVGTNQAWITAFGDFESYVAGDSYNTMLIGGAGQTVTSSMCGTLSAGNAYQTGHFVARSRYQVGGSFEFTKQSVTQLTGGYVGVGNITYPDPNGGGLVLLPVYVSHPRTVDAPRGKLPGYWAAGHNLSTTLTTGDTFSGAVGTTLEGKTFECFMGYSTTQCLFILETSNTW